MSTVIKISERPGSFASTLLWFYKVLSIIEKSIKNPSSLKSIYNTETSIAILTSQRIMLSELSARE